MFFKSRTSPHLATSTPGRSCSVLNVPCYPILCCFCSLVPSITNVQTCLVNVSSSFKVQLNCDLSMSPSWRSWADMSPRPPPWLLLLGSVPLMSISPTWSMWPQGPCTTWSPGLHRGSLENLPDRKWVTLWVSGHVALLPAPAAPPLILPPSIQKAQGQHIHLQEETGRRKEKTGWQFFKITQQAKERRRVATRLHSTARTGRAKESCEATI